MDFRQLTAFLAVANQGNFTKAAASLNYSQSTISEQISALEERLGVKLFERLGRTVTLTEEGKKLLPHARQVCKLCAEIPLLFAADLAVSGTLTIAAAETLCIALLPNLIRQFRTTHPNIQIALKVAECSEFPGLLRTNAADVAFTMIDETRQNDLICIHYSEETTAVICSPDHPLTQTETLHPRDLTGHNLILTEDGCGYRAKFEAALTAFGAQPNSTVAFGSIEAIKQCVKSGLGVSLLPLPAVAKECAAGELCRLNWQGPPIVAETHIAYHRDKWLSPALTAFLDAALGFRPAGRG